MLLETFSHLAGVPVHYDRYAKDSGFGYGTRGKPHLAKATPEMIRTLENCFIDIFSLSPFGPAEVIITAGAYVDKPGQHGLGQAFDLDGIFWSKERFIALEYPVRPHIYLAVESVIRQHFGTVLNYNYNPAHQDHFHLDIGTPVGFQEDSKSRVEYLQASLLHIHRYHVEINGVWGAATDKVTSEALRGLGITGSIKTKEVWLEYLRITTILGFQFARTHRSHVV